MPVPSLPKKHFPPATQRRFLESYPLPLDIRKAPSKVSSTKLNVTQLPSIPEQAHEPLLTSSLTRNVPSAPVTANPARSTCSNSTPALAPQPTASPDLKCPSVYNSAPQSPPKRGRPGTPLTPRTLKPNSTPVNTNQLRTDRLGTLVAQLTTSLESAGSWEEFVTSFRGRSYLSNGLDNVNHPASTLLREWRDHGVPVLTTAEPWTTEQLDSCVARGCHKSATEHAEFLREEMSDFIDSRFWVVLPYDKIKHLPNLQLSPAAIKVERERRPRLLCDHSWYPVNDTTAPHAPPEAMQFGGALHRTLRHVRHANPKYGPVFIAKHDIKDGFYRMFLRASQSPRLAIIMPQYAGEPQLVAIPMSSTMGWTQSPPTFSTMSETIADLTNSSFSSNPRCQQLHRLDEAAAALDDFSQQPLSRGPDDATATARLLALHPDVAVNEPEDETTCPPSNRQFNRPIGETDVFVDDFIQAGQGGHQRMKALRNHLLHAIDTVLAQPNLDETHRNEAISLKKLLQGDGSWNTRKVILGWIVDTIRHTIELPPHRKETLAQIFEELSGLRRVSAKKWASVLGRLRFVSVAIPGSAGLFSALQWAQNKAGSNRVRINRFVRDSLDAFGRLATSLCHRPTRIAEIVPQEPTMLGATDAAKAGMGGIFYDPSGTPHVWRHPFPADVQRRLISADTPAGDITNSDLEHAALLAQVDAMCALRPLAYATLENFCDNTPAVSRVRKGAVSSHGTAAALCRLSSDHQRMHRYCHLAHFLPGDQNSMADDASRLQHLTDTAFLAHFQQHYPQPTPWQLLRLRPEIVSALTSCLRCKSTTVPPPARPPPLETNSSEFGHPSVTNTRFSRPSVTSTTPSSESATSSSSASATAAKGRKVTLSQLVQSRMPYWRWGRGSPTWVNQIPAKKFLDPPGTIPYSLLSSRGSVTKTTQPNAPILPTYRSSATSGPSSTLTTQNLDVRTNTSATSPSLASTGFSALLNTPPAVAQAAPKPSASATSPSP